MHVTFWNNFRYSFYMRLPLLIFFLSWMSLSGRTQNLVPCNSFESPTHCPPMNSLFNNIKPWYTPTLSTTDWFCNCRSTVNADVWIPINFGGYQQAADGNCYAGIFGYSEAQPNYGEYMEVQLMAPLEKGKTYTIAFYYNLANYSDYALEKIGVWLMRKEYNNQHMISRPPFTPTLTNKEPLQNDTVSWHLFRETYTAMGGEKFLMIGFPPKVDTVQVYGKNFPVRRQEDRYELMPAKSAYYYIDKIYVGEQDPEWPEEIAPSAKQKEIVKNPDPVITPKQEFKINEVVTFKELNFEKNSYKIMSSSYRELDRLVEYLKKNPAYSIEIRGHTDSDGDDASNMELSQQRAKAVALYLESNGISPDRIKYKGYGETMPIVPNTSKENMLRNRRVEFVLRTKQ